MSIKTNILTDSFGRKHTYLRISLTERCNLRCTYCMPENGIPLTPRPHLMTADEIITIASTFVDNGITKIRLTGGEPLVRKDFAFILEELSKLPVDIRITTNGILVDRYLSLFKKSGIKELTISLDTLQENRFIKITRRNQFQQVWNTIKLLSAHKIKVKLNVVLIKGVNDDEIIDFVNITKDNDITIRFIEFMPFDGNKWDKTKLVSFQQILDLVQYTFPLQLTKLKDSPNDTSRNYKITSYKGSFSIISSVTNPFCDTCNRIRLTANGKLKNCLFSQDEVSLLTPLRSDQPILPYVKKALESKFMTRGGMDTSEKLENPDLHTQNRSMITIGG